MKFYLTIGNQPEKEVTKEEYVRYERKAGFRKHPRPAGRTSHLGVFCGTDKRTHQLRQP